MGSTGVEAFFYYLLLVLAAFGLRQAWSAFTVVGRTSKLARHKDSAQLLPKSFLLKAIEDGAHTGNPATISHLLFDKRQSIRDAAVESYKDLDPSMATITLRCCREMIHGRVDPVVDGRVGESNRIDRRFAAWQLLRKTLKLTDEQIIAELGRQGAQCKDAIFWMFIRHYEDITSCNMALIQQSMDTLNSASESADWLPELVQLINAHHKTRSKWFVVYNCVWRAGPTTAKILLLPNNREVISDGVCSGLCKLGLGDELKQVIAHELHKLQPEMPDFRGIPGFVREDIWAAQEQLRTFEFWIERATDYGVAEPQILEACLNCSAATDLSLYAFGGLKYEPLATKLVYSIAHNRTPNHEAILTALLKQQLNPKALGVVFRRAGRSDPSARFVLAVLEAFTMLGSDSMMAKVSALISGLRDEYRPGEFYRSPDLLKANLQIAVDFSRAKKQFVAKLEFSDEPAFVFGTKPNWVGTGDRVPNESTIPRDDLSIQTITNVGATAFLVHYRGRTIPVFESGAVHCFPDVRHDSRTTEIVYFNDAQGTRKRAREGYDGQHGEVWH